MANHRIEMKIEGGKRCHGLHAKRGDEHPLVSIITAVYNGNQTIEDTINSVIGQDYPNVEYLVVDGGSTDGTVDTLKKYNDVIDYWISEKDNGVYDALNKGIDLALGDWIYFIGADDRLYDGHVLHRFLSNPTSSKMLYGNVLWGNTGKTYDGAFTLWKLFFQNICQQAIFYHRDLFTLVGKFNPKYPILADWLFNMQVFAFDDTKPTYRNTIVAIYSNKGMSSLKSDSTFYHDHEKIIREVFGILNYFRFKIYNVWKALTSYFTS